MRNADASAAFAVKGIEHVVLLVCDLDRALEFYESVLGARLQSRLSKLAMVELRAGECHIDLVDISVPEGSWARPPIAGGRNVDHIGLRVEAADEAALRRHLAAHAVEVVEERVETEGDRKILSLYVRDPSGNVIELMSAYGEPV